MSLLIFKLSESFKSLSDLSHSETVVPGSASSSSAITATAIAKALTCYVLVVDFNDTNTSDDCVARGDFDGKICSQEHSDEGKEFGIFPFQILI